MKFNNDTIIVSDEPKSFTYYSGPVPSREEQEKYLMPLAKGKNCSSSCLTKDHFSFGECMRAKNLNLNPNLADTDKTISTERELQAYRDARRQGVRPDGTTMAKVEQAMKISDATGKAYGS